jgi:hypothetical protein
MGEALQTEQLPGFGDGYKQGAQDGRAEGAEIMKRAATAGAKDTARMLARRYDTLAAESKRGAAGQPSGSASWHRLDAAHNAYSLAALAIREAFGI